MATITPVEDRVNLFKPLLVTGAPVVMSDPVALATKDPGLFGCFNNCCCSPVLWLWVGWCCNPIPYMLVTDTMTRMRFDISDCFVLFVEVLVRIYAAFEASSNGDFFCFHVVFAFSIAFDACLLSTLKTTSNNLHTGFCVSYYIVATIDFLFAIHIFVIGIRTRYSILQKPNIPVGKCKGAEDCCCVFWCGCCSTQQLTRHTADNETYDTEWCSTPV